MTQMTGRRHSISGVFVFMLLGMFAVFSTLLVLFAAQAYRNVTVRSEKHSDTRILCSYLTNTVRSCDGDCTVSVDNVDGMDVLTVYRDYDGEGYITRIYCKDGMLRELFTSAENTFEPDNGETITGAEAFSAGIDNGVVTMRVTDTSGNEHTLHIALRAEEVPAQ